MTFQRITVAIASLVIVVTSLVIGLQLYNLYQEESILAARGNVSFGGGSGGDPFDVENFSPMQVVPTFPAITKVPTKKVAEVEKEVTDDELVLGVELNGKFRAYPINQLTGPIREIFNDELGEVPIAATW